MQKPIRLDEDVKVKLDIFKASSKECSSLSGAVDKLLENNDLLNQVKKSVENCCGDDGCCQELNDSLNSILWKD